MRKFGLILTLVIVSLICGCGSQSKNQAQSDEKTPEPQARYLYPDDYMADPAAYVFNGRVYIYPSHDWRSSITHNANGEAFQMKDYHVFSMDDVENGAVTAHGKILDLKDIPWATSQLWDNAVAFKNGKYYMYFPARDKNNVFRIGVAIADRPEGQFIPEKEPIKGSYSIDPCVLDDNGTYYLYFGGTGSSPAGLSSSIARVVKLSDDMLQFAEEPRPIVLYNKNGTPITGADFQFFEASWMHKYNGKYYFSYSTGHTHRLCYAIGDNPYGPFTYQGVVLTPVVGWTTHHSIVEYKGKWWLFFHDSRPSGGTDWLRSMKVIELRYNDDGSIKTIKGGGFW
jgi:beta-xylosidase